MLCLYPEDLLCADRGVRARTPAERLYCNNNNNTAATAAATNNSNKKKNKNNNENMNKNKNNNNNDNSKNNNNNNGWRRLSPGKNGGPGSSSPRP